MEVAHSHWTTEQYVAAADYAAVIACATNRLADANHMPAGGYGYYGTQLSGPCLFDALHAVSGSYMGTCM